LAKEEASKQLTNEKHRAPESQLNMISKAVAGVRESVDERFALMQKAIADRSDIEQIRETISEELGHSVQERLKVTV
jgi:hypothetical protein